MRNLFIAGLLTVLSLTTAHASSDDMSIHELDNPTTPVKLNEISRNTNYERYSGLVGEKDISKFVSLVLVHRDDLLASAKDGNNKFRFKLALDVYDGINDMASELEYLNWIINKNHEINKELKIIFGKRFSSHITEEQHDTYVNCFW